MANFSRARKKRLVLDIGTSAIRLCEIAPTKTGYQLARYVQKEFNSDPALDDAAKAQAVDEPSAIALMLYAWRPQMPYAPLVATIALIAVMGVVAGLIMPSRDMLVRVVSPPDAVGRVFGIVTTGFNFGGMLGPVLGGWLVDHDMPRLIFFGSAAFMLATIAIAVFVPVPTSCMAVTTVARASEPTRIQA